MSSAVVRALAEPVVRPPVPDDERLAGRAAPPRVERALGLEDRAGPEDLVEEFRPAGRVTERVELFAGVGAAPDSAADAVSGGEATIVRAPSRTVWGFCAGAWVRTAGAEGTRGAGGLRAFTSPFLPAAGPKQRSGSA
ncbi:MAG: hypothetical protein Q4G64_07065 [bacterium]|nr:hypothetical protein [bacterium]